MKIVGVAVIQLAVNYITWEYRELFKMVLHISHAHPVYEYQLLKLPRVAFKQTDFVWLGVICHLGSCQISVKRVDITRVLNSAGVEHF